MAHPGVLEGWALRISSSAGSNPIACLEDSLWLRCGDGLKRGLGRREAAEGPCGAGDSGQGVGRKWGARCLQGAAVPPSTWQVF